MGEIERLMREVMKLNSKSSVFRFMPAVGNSWQVVFGFEFARGPTLEAALQTLLDILNDKKDRNEKQSD